jgi:pimeloyl-ACP methyl ester carboxylesterase
MGRGARCPSFPGDISAVLEAVAGAGGPARSVLVGQSIGAAAALRAGLSRPGRVAGLVLTHSLGGIRHEELAGVARPAGVTIGLHICRGNQASMWMGEGDYDPIAERLFSSVDVDRFLLEVAEGGNLLTEDEQFAKLRLVAETARAIWG